MTRNWAARLKPRKSGRAEPDALTVLGALPDAVVLIDGQDFVRYVNQAAEQFFDSSAAHICGEPLSNLLPTDSAMFALIQQVRQTGTSVSEEGLSLDGPRIGMRFVAIKAAPLSEPDDSIVVSIHERSIARKIDRQLIHRGAARSVTAMAAILAHEVKNPLSGIRGAAQLIEQSASEGDRELTRLICDETDRICKLVDRLDIFTDQRPIIRGAVNIHRVLEHVRRLAQSGFARSIRFTENYDPSLPPVLGHRDQLIQVFLNLVKNAAEAAPEGAGEIIVGTSYQHGVRLAVQGSDTRVELPLVVTIQDNGPGIPEDIRPHLFDPFVTTKAHGTGLGLALVAKIIGDHGGVIEFDSQPRRTVFRVMLPIAAAGEGEPGQE
jgi:two-component system, NtrC family, nitrogen regulation sensor histidine kinase GlnL